MDTQALVEVLFPATGPKQLTADQEKILRHREGPAWVLAGPGSGKTEVLAALVLRLLYVNNDDSTQQERIAPESIIITTFTDKAARNLEDRISVYRSKIVERFPALQDIDISRLRIGTLHGLCNDLLQEFRAPNYQNVRLMDEFEQSLFVYEHMSLIKHTDPEGQMAFWREFAWMFEPREWQSHYSYPPNRWNSTKALVKLLNRLVEDRVSITSLRGAGEQLVQLAEYYKEYMSHLEMNFRCDFSQLQSRFLKFTYSQLGESFVGGEDSPVSPGVKWVLVDEYQDTNRIQEEIYFQLARRPPHNLVVVGDDDQAMYRFRGASVECMVTFDEACATFFPVPKSSVSTYPLVDNFRSHHAIVTLFDAYIAAFPAMNEPLARAQKPAIRPRKEIAEVYPATGCISGATLQNLAGEFAVTVRGLVDGGVVNDPSECCLLLKSTKESPQNAQRYVEALGREGLEVYNPRNKAFIEQEEVQAFLGALLAVTDPGRRYALESSKYLSRPVRETECKIRDGFEGLLRSNDELADYVRRFTGTLAGNPGIYLDPNLQELGYYLISLEPFSSWQEDHTRRVRLGKLTALLEAFSSMPVMDPSTGEPRERVVRGRMQASEGIPGEIREEWLHSFYHLFLGYILDTGFDDEEDEDIIVPTGAVPIMTIHQSKGLQFPFVFVGSLSGGARVSLSHRMESLFSNYPENAARVFRLPKEELRAEMDLIRQFYVAYSRAVYALILLGTESQFRSKSIPLGPQARWMRHRTEPL